MELWQIGIGIILIGFFILILSASSSGKVSWAVGGFIGPIPFGFANDKKMLWLVILLTIAVAISFFLIRIR